MSGEDEDKPMADTVVTRPAVLPADVLKGDGAELVADCKITLKGGHCLEVRPMLQGADKEVALSY
jgi:hypothetical protein